MATIRGEYAPPFRVGTLVVSASGWIHKVYRSRLDGDGRERVILVDGREFSGSSLCPFDPELHTPEVTERCEGCLGRRRTQ
jgi:hypothetical protein